MEREQLFPSISFYLVLAWKTNIGQDVSAGILKMGRSYVLQVISTLAFQFPRVSPAGQPLETNKNQETGKLGKPMSDFMETYTRKCSSMIE